MQWSSSLGAAYSKVILRCPPNTAYTGTAELFYVDGAIDTPVVSTSIQSDSTGQYFEFVVNEPILQNAWKVVWSSLDMAIQSITVTGAITQTTKPSGPRPQSTLVIYPANSVPETVINSQGQEVPATYCQLAYIDVDAAYKLTEIVDLRYIIHRDFQPVADWLTDAFDTNLINLFEQVSAYQDIWMAPPNCTKQEYVALEQEQVIVQ